MDCREIRFSPLIFHSFFVILGSQLIYILFLWGFCSLGLLFFLRNSESWLKAFPPRKWKRMHSAKKTKE